MLELLNVPRIRLMTNNPEKVARLEKEGVAVVERLPLALPTILAGINQTTMMALSMVIIVMAGSLIGAALPFVFDRLGFDPATASAPLVTSMVDAAGVIAYFAIATKLMGLL